MYAILAMLLYLTTGELPFQNGSVENALEYKKTTSAEMLCVNAKWFIPFAEHVYNLEFADEPNYSILKFML